MASSTETLTDDHALELIVRDPSSPASHGGSAADAASGSDEITPLLTQIERPKINIFSASFSRRKPREQVLKVTESESFHIAQFFSWLWSGSRYAGFLCMALSSTLYFMMELISDGLSVQSIPLFETAFMRCTTILILSYLWLRRSGQPIFGPSHARKLLILRALVGYLSLFCFIFSIRMLPLSQAIVLSFASPIMASIAARIILREKLKIIDIGALVCSFFGILFIFRPMITVQVEPEGINGNFKGEHHIYAVLMGLFSSITGGISYCLIKAGAKASEQPLITVLLFGVVACPAAAMCMLAFENVVVPALYSLINVAVLGLLAFFAEVLLARALQLEKISKVANILYIEAALSQLWMVSSRKVASGLSERLVGCLLILISVSCTVYMGPDKDPE
ncbi:PREDICTED: uncharacterized protein LOC104815344 isoform X1 [Tarenaya hassleriana]|uniref:uncharacterized protein LOC104815344 isoform X1 n=1 Tax=Tarenaya hassleriana TaxID=28532 RepID=UPI00053C3B94|nr:PREDICTED: uncharacterized protein LOC104815344 isoform X1 [Tarenaya hassleriana]